MTDLVHEPTTAAPRPWPPAPPFDLPRPLVCIHEAEVAELVDGVGWWSTPLHDTLEVACSECGPITDHIYMDPLDEGWYAVRLALQNIARAHALEAHDGDVDAEGWAR